jgi:hypothetical protein
MRGAPMCKASPRGAFTSAAGAASRGVASGSGALAASLLKIRIGSRGTEADAAVPAQPTLAAAKTAKATNEMARSWLMAEAA